MLVSIVIVMETRPPEELVMPTKNLFHKTILIISGDEDKIFKIDIAEKTQKQCLIQHTEKLYQASYSICT